MAAPYSMDLRTHVLDDADAGVTSNELAEGYHVSRAWVDRLRLRRRGKDGFPWLKQNEVLAACPGRRRDGSAGRLVAARPDATLAELRDSARPRDDDDLARPSNL